MTSLLYKDLKRLVLKMSINIFLSQSNKISFTKTLFFINQINLGIFSDLENEKKYLNENCSGEINECSDNMMCGENDVCQCVPGFIPKEDLTCGKTIEKQ